MYYITPVGIAYKSFSTLKKQTLQIECFQKGKLYMSFYKGRVWDYAVFVRAHFSLKVLLNDRAYNPPPQSPPFELCAGFLQ